MITVPKEILLATVLLSLAIVVPYQSATMAITFQVKNYSNQPIQGATISLSGVQSVSQNTDANGNATLNVPFGSYSITVSKASCTQIGPQPFIVDQTAPSSILVRLQCS